MTGNSAPTPVAFQSIGMMTEPDLPVGRPRTISTSLAGMNDPGVDAGPQLLTFPVGQSGPDRYLTFGRADRADTCSRVPFTWP